MDITKIPIQKLLEDKEESIVDKRDCMKALMFGVRTYSGGSVKERLDINDNIINKIDKELK